MERCSVELGEALSVSPEQWAKNRARLMVCRTGFFDITEMRVLLCLFCGIL
jgi:hypothetical protein